MKGAVGVVCLLLNSLISYGQAQDTVFIGEALSTAKLVHDEALATESQLYNGTLYKPFDRFTEGHLFFLEEDYIEGTVQYDGANFVHTPLQYDLLQDVLLTERNGTRIKLNQQKVQEFNLSGHRFVRIESTKANRAPKSGFYEVLHEGYSSAYAVHRKEIDSRSNLKVQSSTRYYILKDGVFYPVRNKGSVLNVFADRKRDLKQQISSQRFHFGDPLHGIPGLVKMYDQLSR